MNWLLLTIVAILSRATYSIATKILSKDVKVSPITHSLLLTGFSGLLSLIISPYVGGLSLKGIENYLTPTLLMVLSQAFGNILFFKGIKKLDAGTTQIAFSSILIWGTVLSVLYLGSIFSLKQSLGVLLMLIAIIIVQYKKGKIDLNSSFLFVMASAVLFAIFQVSSAEISSVFNTGTYLVMAYLGPTIIVTFLYFKKIKQDFSQLVNQIKSTFLKTLFVSGTSLLYFIFSFIAYRYAPDRGIVVVLLTSQVVLSVIFGIFFLKEKENQIRKLLAGGLAFLAGVLIKSQ